MDDVSNLINYLLKSNHSIDRLDTISNQLNLSQEQIHRILRADRYKDYFQLLKSVNQTSEKLVLTLDLFCCTHYAHQCKNQSCPFLHLCPYNIRPIHGRCTNKTCPYEHEVLKSNHNQQIITKRGLAFLSEQILFELARASADPDRSFWICTDYGKKEGCSKKSRCDKLHYCYFSLTNACTKSYCQHEITEACLAYFRRKELAEQNHDDILQIFRKVLRQRKPDFVSRLTLAPHPTWTRQLSAAAPEYQSQISVNNNEPVAEDDRDVFLSDCGVDDDERTQTESLLTQEIGFRIRLINSKAISSKFKQTFSSNFFYLPIENFSELFSLLRCQNTSKKLSKPLTIYSNLHEAHDATEYDIENNQFSLLRVKLSRFDSSQSTTIEIFDPSVISFDRLWLYAYHDQDIL